eukprot:4889241-Prymnesium_polylepis.1
MYAGEAARSGIRDWQVGSIARAGAPCGPRGEASLERAARAWKRPPRGRCVAWPCWSSAQPRPRHRRTGCVWRPRARTPPAAGRWAASSGSCR